MRAEHLDERGLALELGRAADALLRVPLNGSMTALDLHPIARMIQRAVPLISPPRPAPADIQDAADRFVEALAKANAKTAKAISAEHGGPGDDEV